MKICPNQYTDLVRLLFTEDSLKIKKELPGTDSWVQAGLARLNLGYQENPAVKPRKPS